MRTRGGGIAWQFAHRKNHRFLHSVRKMPFESEDSEKPEAGWEVGFGDFLEPESSHSHHLSRKWAPITPSIMDSKLACLTAN